ncbi:hypothetical protein SCLCIDRAFT_131949 [Scleroderma citrinum Foug A]|uniref:F-box domain-containing protein n=1 Tax=Scleroderma citrinum Foug A TaxID=1036808 RepID=A0A0C2Z448_9AGAM|nr:hypothetical protein SCLCIDRAFT_131949 [Scleroderma citrinum Foug A]
MRKAITYPDPPTPTSLSLATMSLSTDVRCLDTLSTRISTAERELAAIVAERRAEIRALEEERHALEEKVRCARAYVAPVKRIPLELLRAVFLEDGVRNSKCCPWVLASVCKSWRRLSLSIPKLWSKIRITTTQSASPDNIRLWLERSGTQVPLDIDIYLRVSFNNSATPIGGDGLSTHRRRRRRRSSSPPPPWAQPHIITTLAPLPWITPTPPPAWGSPPPTPPLNRNMHWGYIALFYLVEHMRRWRRFVFRFERPFVSMAALKSIVGDAPMLQEFDVSCAESTSLTDWSWLPSIPPLHRHAPHPTPTLTSLALTNVPFKYSSPIFTAGSLRALHLHGLASLSLPLDRVLHLITSNPSLESLALYFSALTPPVLPLPNPDISPVRLSKLHTLRICGHPLLANIADVLVCPALQTLGVEVDLNAQINGGMGMGMGGHAGMGREPVEETAIGLVRRSGHPDVTSLYIAYTTCSSSSLGMGLGGSVISWSFLGEMASLEKLEVGGTQLEPLVGALRGAGGAGAGNLVCPRLKSVIVRDAQGHPDAIAKLVQMVEARNPDVLPSDTGGGAGAATGTGGGDGTIPSKLRKLEIWDCVPLGADVVDWLKRRVEDVVIVDPPYSKATSSSSSGGWM